MHPYIMAAIGGVLIGLSAVLLMAFSGRIAGVSGIVGGLLPPKPATDRSWRLSFVLGLVLAPLILRMATGASGIGAPAVDYTLLLAAGLLVGAGTAFGGGCTSGHGICGLARLSPRSAVAVAHDGKILFSDVSAARMTMRPLSEAAIDGYLDEAGETVTSSVGAYQLEGLGVHLFERIEGDHFTILGLPLLPLLAFLRSERLLGV